MLGQSILLFLLYLGAGLLAKIIFQYSDQDILKNVQNASNFLTRKIGKDNYEIATFLLILLNASSIILVSLILYFTDLPRVNYIVLFLPVFLFFYYLYVIQKSKKIYSNSEDKIAINYLALKEVERKRESLYRIILFSLSFTGYILLYFKPDEIVFSTIIITWAIYTHLCNLLVVYFASCYPGIKEKSTIWQSIKNFFTQAKLVEVKN